MDKKYYVNQRGEVFFDRLEALNSKDD